MLYLFRKTNNAIGLLEADRLVKPETLDIGKLAVAGELCTTFFLYPALAGSEKLSGNALLAIRLGYEDAL
jgi:hypothetical protein